MKKYQFMLFTVIVCICSQEGFGQEGLFNRMEFNSSQYSSSDGQFNFEVHG